MIIVWPQKEHKAMAKQCCSNQQLVIYTIEPLEQRKIGHELYTTVATSFVFDIAVYIQNEELEIALHRAIALRKR